MPLLNTNPSLLPPPQNMLPQSGVAPNFGTYRLT
jgi:hypothetical protein